ncbi:MAG TPA: HDOD domain-containing protein [Telluria sp.]|nr:HDOD domain-containing protein [Telluria sp.]
MYHWLQRLFTGTPKDEEAEAEAPPPPAPAMTPPPAPRPAAATAKGSGIPFDHADLAERLYHAWLFGIEGEASLDLTAEEAEVLGALEAILNTQQSGAAMVRRMPGLIPQLLQSLRSESFSGAQISKTISSDLVLVAAVTRLANNSMQGSGKSIDSVEHAIIVIGQEGLRHLITSVAFRPIIDLNSGHYTRLLAPRIWERSERCANANRALAPELGIEPFEAFLAGLVQNAGLIVALRVMDQVSKGAPGMGSEFFCARLAQLARALSCSIGREWNFPEAVTQAISEQGTTAKGASVSPLGRLMALTDYMSKLRVLVEQERIEYDDPKLFSGLPALAPRCYEAVQPVEDIA